MVRPSNPRFMSRVLEAVTHLSEGKGSSARDVLAFVRQNSSTPARNLTMQVHRALKHAVNAGLLRLKSGRYKALVAVNPIRANLHHAVEPNNRGLKASVADTEELPVGDPSHRIQERRGRRRRRSRGRRRRSARRRRRRSRHRRRESPERRTRKMREARRKGVEEEVEEWAVPRRKSHAEDLEEQRAGKKGRGGSSAEGTTYSDDSIGGPEYDDNRKIRKVKRASHSSSRKRSRRPTTTTTTTKTGRRSNERKNDGKTERRSSSRQRSQQQLPVESPLESPENRMESDEVPVDSTNEEERRENNSQEEEIDRNEEPDNCASGSDL